MSCLLFVEAFRSKDQRASLPVNNQPAVKFPIPLDRLDDLDHVGRRNFE
jgi:hypothetical protein